MNAIARLVVWLLAVALVALPVVAVLKGWIGADRWPLTTLRATGQFDRVDETRLREALLPYARQGFFAVDLDGARAAVAGLPWVEQAEVRKRWPDVLEVSLVEHVPYARWGEDRLLSVHGRLFDAAGAPVPAALPLLHGPDGRVEEVVEVYRHAEGLFAPAGLVVRAIDMDARGNWTLALDNGTRVVVGRSQARSRLERFSRLVPRLLPQPGKQLEQADLRYTNGFALRWADAPTQPQEAS